MSVSIDLMTSFEDDKADTSSRIEALKGFLIEAEGFKSDEVLDIKATDYDPNLFEVAGREYHVLTDDEAEDILYDYCKDSLWCFNPSFLASHSAVDEEVFVKLQELCESSNDAVRSLIRDFDHLVKCAVMSDGRGHFINSYDGVEEEYNGFFIYRNN